MHAALDVDQGVPAPTRQRLLAQRPFQMLWLGEGISLVGDQLHLVALSWITLELTGSTSVLGFVLALNMVARRRAPAARVAAWRPAQSLRNLFLLAQPFSDVGFAATDTRAPRRLPPGGATATMIAEQGRLA